MKFYEIDILEVKSGVVKRVEAFSGWTEQSPAMYARTMCDCNLGGCRDREIRMVNGERSIQAHEGASYMWRKLHGECDHSMPPKRMKVLKAYISDGRVYDFEKGDYVKVAA